MTGRLNLGNNAHAMGAGILQQFDELGSGEIAVAALRQVIGVAVAVKNLCQIALLVERGTATRGHLRQFGETGNLQSPGLIVGEVELDGVDLVVGQEVDRALEVGRIDDEVAGNVEHHATVAKVGPVDDEAVLQAVSLAVVKGSDERLDAIHQRRLGDAMDGDFAVMHAQGVIFAVSAQFLVQQQFNNGFLATGDIHATFLQLIGEQRLGAAVTAPLEPFTVFDRHKAAHLGETVLDVHLLGSGEDVVVVTRVAVAKAVDGLIVGIHVVAVGISLVVTPLPGLVERRAVDVHRNRLGHVPVQHHMATAGHVVLVDESAAHHQVNHQRITGRKRFVIGIGPDAVIGR